jgi:hypothetical protein
MSPLSGARPSPATGLANVGNGSARTTCFPHDLVAGAVAQRAPLRDEPGEPTDLAAVGGFDDPTAAIESQQTRRDRSGSAPARPSAPGDWDPRRVSETDAIVHAVGELAGAAHTQPHHSARAVRSHLLTEEDCPSGPEGHGLSLHSAGTALGHWSMRPGGSTAVTAPVTSIAVSRP